MLMIFQSFIIKKISFLVHLQGKQRLEELDDIDIMIGLGGEGANYLEHPLVLKSM